MFRSRKPLIRKHQRTWFATSTALGLVVALGQVVGVDTQVAHATPAVAQQASPATSAPTVGTIAERAEITYPDITVPKDGQVLVRPTVVGNVDDFSIVTLEGTHAIIAESSGALGELSIEGKAVGTQRSTITIYFTDNSTKQVTLNITVIEPRQSNADTYQPRYMPRVLGAGIVVDGYAPHGAPQGTKFSSDNLPEWVSLDTDSGALRLAPPQDVQRGDHTLNIKVTYPDTTSETIQATITIVTPQAEGANPTWLSSRTLAPGESRSIESTVALPEGARISTVTPKGFSATLSSAKVLNLTAPKNAEPGSAHTVVLGIDYADGSTETYSLPVLITPTFTRSAANPKQWSTPARAGVRWEKPAGTPNWWTLTTEGVLELSEDAPNGTHQLPLVGHYLSTRAETTVRITVAKPGSSTPQDPGNGADERTPEDSSSAGASGWKVWLPIVLSVSAALIGAILAVLADKNSPVRAFFTR
ncbi:Rib/alpha-like domain-containing protein [Corynebacterium felinum]|uniref:Long Rib domain-containing protein n=1 Tax=Corynebacterium felinum TaxID=131318 RepID=A0ABU2B5R1_9CORY|nr:Rib/alpha-like domain-containing protein [Corynebacterium felinum]MDF5821755.1 Rib/alpha-like domain-containing protein [Corynebacterium felinum]MDR7353952.1 hypothetical protein [Corynebacterium felinum]WJY96125.1 Rib/alpha-like repeat protein [Corynebacterium felinum]